MNAKPKNKEEQRLHRHKRIRAKVQGTAKRPRLVVYRSNRFISAQLIDDTARHTLAAAHGREFKGTASIRAAAVGKEVALRAKEVGINTVVFDRGGYRYSGQVKTLADAARAGGLAF